ncbi:gamma-interferon-responsive lysosomal thiol protein [Eucalyptus grandis]|uniref:Uncharacterized protein n=2 Tax=Eucalyptus grandis TaxID=71139 RepID=A0ACC3IXY0_EUCGR|nr:gamma-interferon-responsive lysosomal thiol protein [Eucalyptus grandis]KAK3406828.1 hypothetical protein EUGRSUZ_K02963 [Eucalyptus grandis]
MASGGGLFPFALVTLFLCLTFPSPSLSSDDDKVKLSLYYESLCPGSADFIANHLVKAIDNGLINIIDLQIVPWGNAQIDNRSGAFICQHGEDECYLNTIQACAIEVWSDLQPHFNFIRCVEDKISKGGLRSGKVSAAYQEKPSSNVAASKVWESCAEELKLEEAGIYKCYTSGRGRELELQYKTETDMLIPPHEYTPWVTVNDQPLYYEFLNFMDFVCKAYKGSLAKPPACNSTR